LKEFFYGFYGPVTVLCRFYVIISGFMGRENSNGGIVVGL